MKTVLQWFKRAPTARHRGDGGPISTLMALEPRLMFDGAVGVTADAVPVAERSTVAAERTAAAAPASVSSQAARGFAQQSADAVAQKQNDGSKADASAVQKQNDVCADDPAKNAQPGTVTLTAVARNGVLAGAPADGPVRVAAGDAVTFTLDYDAPAGDFHGLTLYAKLPPGVFDSADPKGDGSRTPLAPSTGGGAVPLPGTWTMRVVGGDGSPVAAPTVRYEPSTNGLVFVFGDRADGGDASMRVQISFTVVAGASSVPDGTDVTAFGKASMLDASCSMVWSVENETLRVAQPSLDLVKGVVQDDVNRATSVWDPVYTPGDPRSAVLPAGTTGIQPLLRTIDASSFRALDADVAGVDAGDTLRFAIVVTNTGSSPRGAFDVTLADSLPWGVDRASVSNLRITYGDGTVLYDGTAATLARLTDGDNNRLTSPDAVIAALLDGCKLRLVDDAGADGVAGTSDDRGALAGALDAAGRPVAPGRNVLVLTYDARLAPWIEPGKTVSAWAALTHYASNERGADLTPIDVCDTATVATPLVAMDHRLVATSEPDRSTAGTDAVIGERLTYEITITLPEGTTVAARLLDTLGPGLSLVSIDSISASSGIVFVNGAPSTGAVRVSSAGGDANRFELDLGDIHNLDTDNSRRETITVRYTAVVDNVAQNRQGATQGATAVLDAACAIIDAAAQDVRIVEPSLSVAIDGGLPRPASGDAVTFTVTITAGTGRPPAQDVTLDVANLVPSGLAYVPGSITQVSGPTASSLAFGGSGLVGNWSTLEPGSVVVIRFDARVSGDTPSQPLEQTATVRWSSLPGTSNVDLSPIATVGDFERTGRTTDPGAALNTYVTSSRAPVSTVDALVPRLELIASSEAGSSGTTVVPGEVLRYRMVVQLPEGALSDVELRPVLPAGLRFVSDGTITLGFVADGAGLSSNTLAGSSYLLPGGGATIASIAGLRPLQPLPASAVRDASGGAVAPGTILPAGQSPRLALGDLTIADRDSNREFVVIEFDAIVDNAAGNVAGSSNPVVFDVTSGGVVVARSNTVVVEVAEPRIVDLSKDVVARDGDRVVFEATFSNTGTQTAYDVRLTDAFAGLDGVRFSGATSRPVGSNDASTSDTLDIRLPTLAPGESATIRYVVTLTDPAAAIAPRDAVVTYTSLSPSGVFLPVQTVAGTRLTPTTGERTGDAADYGGGANTYRDADPAGLAAVRGTLWDDTSTPDGIIGSNEARLAGVTVTLTAAGRDGRLGTGDDLVLTTVTDAQGRYAFGGLPEGEVRITAPTSIANANGTLGEVRARYDVQGSPTDGAIQSRADAGRVVTDLDVGYVQQNDAPTVSTPTRIATPVDGSVPIPGLRIADVDAGPTGVLGVTLTVTDGSLQVTPGVPGVTIGGNGSSSVTLTGTLDALNTALTSVTYVAAPGMAGTDSLRVVVDDRGNTGDADGDGVPNEPGDALTASATVPIRVGPSKFPPAAQPDTNRISANDTRPAQGNVLTGGSAGDRVDTDPDNDPLEVQGVRAGTDTSVVAQGSTGVPVPGRFGTIVVNPDGSYSYRVDLTSTDVQSLKPGQTLTDSFVYTVRDPSGLSSTTTITITIDGVNDAPVSSSTSQTIDRPVPGAPPPRIPVAPPTVSDPDDGTSSLVVRVDTIERPQGGTFLRPDGTPVQPGQTLTVDQLQRLTFVPSTGFEGTPAPNGNTATSSLVFTVSDPSGATSSGRIDLALRPTTPGGGTFPPAPPVDPNASSSISLGGGPVAVAGVAQEFSGYAPVTPFQLPPLGNGPGVQFSVPAAGPGDGPTAISTTVAELRDGTVDGRESLDTASRTTDLDAGGLLPSNRVAGFFGEEAIGPLVDGKSSGGPRPTAITTSLAAGPSEPATALAGSSPVPADAANRGGAPATIAQKSAPGGEAEATPAATAAAPRPQVAADDDCKPVQVAKPRPKPVKRILSDQ
ncbi:MAG: VCBS domain-containing protein, partial [Burkholderiales bacterium]